MAFSRAMSKKYYTKELIKNYTFLQSFPLLWPFCYLVAGTTLMGLWVIAHECGHYTFSPNKKINHCIGFILHSFLLVPYFSWQYSHKKHHKFTNHIHKGETYVPYLNPIYPNKPKISFIHAIISFFNLFFFGRTNSIENQKSARDIRYCLYDQRWILYLFW